MLMSCSGATGEDRSTESRTQAREFSQEDKAAARALSIGNASAIEEAASPYAQALLCRNAIEKLAAQFRQTEGLSDEQIQGIEQVQALYDRRVRLLSGPESKSSENLSHDLDQPTADNSESKTNGRVAIACLRQLQES